MATKQQFDKALAAEKITRCPRCKEKWFNINLKADSICKRCHAKDDSKKQDKAFFYSTENHMDFGAMPGFLPRLEPLEEQLVARVHVSVNVFTVSTLLS